MLKDDIAQLENCLFEWSILEMKSNVRSGVGADTLADELGWSIEKVKMCMAFTCWKRIELAGHVYYFNGPAYNEFTDNAYRYLDCHSF